MIIRTMISALAWAGQQLSCSWQRPADRGEGELNGKDACLIVTWVCRRAVEQ